MCFFGFLRWGKAVVPDDHSFDPTQHLCFKDVAVDSLNNPSLIWVSPKWILLEGSCCRHRSIRGLCMSGGHSIALHGSTGLGVGPLFRFEDGRPLTRHCFVTARWETLQKVDVDSSKSGHSFKIGVATTAAVRGLQDSLIRMLGRWGSVTYQHYIRAPQLNW